MTRLDPPAVLEHGVLRFLTAGSVDDGKSTLIGRLLYDSKAILADQLAALHRTSQRRGTGLDLSLLTDGLTAEREQGITIDVAYRYFATPARKFIVADAPGHAQYTRNMVTAASTAQLAVLLVDARHGVVEQTRRHATIAKLVGIPHLVVAVNKMDLVDWSRERFDAIVCAFTEFARQSGIDDVLFVPMSAFHGDMLVDRGERLSWYEGPTLLQILETVEVEETLDHAPLRLPIQYVARPDGDLPRRYLGRIEAGSIAAGDDVTLLPSQRRTRVRDLLAHDGSHASAGLHASVGVVLQDDVDVSRGDMIVHSGALPRIGPNVQAADLCWLSDAPLDPSRTFLVRHTTREVRGRIASIDWRLDMRTQEREEGVRTLNANDIARIGLALAQPLFTDAYEALRATGSFVLIDEATNDTVAAGMVSP